jgi:hypothetical protein
MSPFRSIDELLISDPLHVFAHSCEAKRRLGLDVLIRIVAVDFNKTVSILSLFEHSFLGTEGTRSSF